MLSRYKLRHTATGLLDKFIGRNNDYEGYWALGVLYTEARVSGNRVALDLLTAKAQPASGACTGLARTWADYLREALGRHGLCAGDLAAATISLEFGLPPVPKRPGYVEYGDPFSVLLRLVSRDGLEFARQGTGHCKPYDEFRGSRSTRYKG